MARDARRHGRADDDRRAPAARAAVSSATRTSASPTATASPTSTSARSCAFHREQGTTATVTAVQPPGRFGALDVEGARVREFEEKPRGDGGWTNGGFFVLSPDVGRYIDGDDTVWEQGPMRSLARDGRAVVLPPRRLLAGDGHAARSQPPRGAVELRQAPLADLGVGGDERLDDGAAGERRARLLARAARARSPATRASRARGWRCGCSRSARA